jgi:iron complex outermembrane receptor protein
MSMACVVALNLALYGEDLGKISVESSTINDNYETKKSEVSSSVVFTSEDIKKINPTSISDILRRIPGVTSEFVGTDSVKIHLRGVDNQMYMGEQPGVAIVIDGVAVQETSGKINVELDNIESIKVIKGGASYLYGNDALAGAIVITTKNPKGQKSSSTIETEAGSFGTKRFLASTNQAFEKSALQLQGSYRDTDGYWDQAYVTEKSINGKYQYYINDTSDITFGSDVTKRKSGDGNDVSGVTNAEIDPRSVNKKNSYSNYYDTTLTKSFLTYSNDIDDKSNFLLRLSKYSDDKTYTSGAGTTGKAELWNQNGAKAEYKKSFDAMAVMVGVDIQRNGTDEKSNKLVGTNGPLGQLTASYDTKENINGLYTEVKYQINDKLSSTLNLRHDSIKHEYLDDLNSSKNVSPTYSGYSYRFGTNYDLSQNDSLYASIATGFRAPTVGQTSSNQVYLDTHPTSSIPAVMELEKTYNYEIGVRGKTSSLNYDTSIYQLDRKNYIGKIAGSYVTDTDAENNNYDNVGDMRSRGFEFALGTQEKKELGFNLAYTYLDSKFTHYVISRQTKITPKTFVRTDLSGNEVPRTSKHKVNLTVDYRPTSNLTISPELIAKSSYYADEINLQKQKGYEVVNLRAEYKLNDSLEFFGKIDNLMDKTYYEFVNLTSAAVNNTMESATIRVAAPRAYYAGLRYKF